MAIEIMTVLADLLRISPELVRDYASVTPLEQIFYLFFFPTLFIIVFIYILVSHWMKEHRGLRILIAVAVYAFIIFQGLYDWFVILSKFWLFGLILIGVVWFIFRPKEGGGAKGLTSGKGKFSKVIGFAEDLTGKKLDPKEAAKLNKMLMRDLERLAETKKSLESRVEKLKHDPVAANMVYQQLGDIDTAIANLEKFKQSGNLKDYEEWRKDTKHLFKL